MKALATIVTILFCLILTAGALQADILPPFGTTVNYGIWYDRDGVSPSQATQWGAVDGGTYNTEGIYDIVITYHAVDATTATMFATINGIQQGFYTAPDWWDNKQPDIYPAGLSFTNSDMTQMQVFRAIWGTDPGGTDPRTKIGTAVFENITATQGPTSINYGGATYSGLPTFSGDPASQLGGAWDLTAGDLILSYRVDFSGINEPDNDWKGLVFAVGLQPYGLDRRTPPGGGWMGNVVANTAANNASLNLNDKFDLQNSWNDELAYNVTAPVPEPATMPLFGSALIGCSVFMRKKFKK